MSRREGTRQYYQTDPKGVAGMREYLDSMWTQSLAAFKALAEQEEQ